MTEPPRRTGNHRDIALGQLEQLYPDVYARVLAGELSAHAGMVEVGMRKPAFTVTVTTPERIAGILRRHLEPHVLRAVVDVLK